MFFAIAVVFLWDLRRFPSRQKKEFVSNDKDRLLIELISHVIQRGHFNVKSLNDEMSEQIFHTYLESIDGQKRYFLQSDYREFAKYMYQIDDQLRELDLTFFDLTYQRLILRMNEVESLYQSLLSQPFDFEKVESFDMDYEEQLFPLSQPARSEKVEKATQIINAKCFIRQGKRSRETTRKYRRLCLPIMDGSRRGSSINDSRKHGRLFSI